MARLTNEELNKIQKKFNVNRIWSYSRINTFQTSPYEYLLSYIKHIPSDKTDSIYVYTGSLSHDTLDKFYENKIKYEDMITEFNDGWTVYREISQLKFDRTDESRDTNIAEKYKINLQHFFNYHTIYKHKLLIEKPIVINVNHNIFVGYADAIFKDDKGNYHIIDFKSSSIFTGNVLNEHSTQLLLYAYGLSQMMNIPIDRIKCCFNFLKYCTIEYQQANGVIKTRNVERYKLGESLQSNLKVWIKKFGYTDQMDNILKEVLDTNGIECLPEDLRNMYKITDCHIYINVNQEAIDKLVEEITSVIEDINFREANYETTKSDKCFWDSEESIKKQSYYFANLCSYSANLHKPYKEYLESRENGAIDLFGNVGADVKAEIQSSAVDTSLDWLNDI